MRIHKINEFTRGWFVGKFDPSVLKSDFEVACQFHPKGEDVKPHFHKKSEEINLVMSGEMILNEKRFTKGDIFIIEPYEVIFVEYLQDTEIVVVRNVSDVNDKFIVSVNE